MPVVMLGLINFMTPGYSHVLFYDPLGHKLLVRALPHSSLLGGFDHQQDRRYQGLTPDAEETDTPLCTPLFYSMIGPDNLLRHGCACVGDASSRCQPGCLRAGVSPLRSGVRQIARSPNRSSPVICRTALLKLVNWLRSVLGMGVLNDAQLARRAWRRPD